MPTPLLILYATVTGNAEMCAKSIADAARLHGYEPRVRNVDRFDIKQLANEPAVIFAVSTYGDGEAPSRAQKFWDELQAHSGSLENLRYAIYAIGDSTYDEFCGFGKKLDAKLKSKGAVSMIGRSENDIDCEAGLPAFCASVFAVLPNILQPAN